MIRSKTSGLGRKMAELWVELGQVLVTVGKKA
jgi:hypothetical protein